MSARGVCAAPRVVGVVVAEMNFHVVRQHTTIDRARSLTGRGPHGPSRVAEYLAAIRGLGGSCSASQFRFAVGHRSPTAPLNYLVGTGELRLLAGGIYQLIEQAGIVVDRPVDTVATKPQPKRKQAKSRRIAQAAAEAAQSGGW